MNNINDNDDDDNNNNNNNDNNNKNNNFVDNQSTDSQCLPIDTVVKFAQ